MKKISALFLLSLFSLGIHAQDNTTDVMDKIRLAYRQVNTMSFSLVYSYYEDVKKTTPIKVSKGTVKMSDRKFFITLDKVEILKNDSFLIVADNESKVLMVDSGNASLPANYSSNISVDTLFKYMGKTSLKTSTNQYELIAEEDENSVSLIKKTEVLINKSTYRIDKITIYYKTIYDETSNTSWNAKMTIEYTNVKINKSIAASAFNSSRFIFITGKKIAPVARLKSYELINHIE